MMPLPNFLSSLGVTICLFNLIITSNSQSPGDVRLVGSFIENEGRVEIFHSESWGTICDRSWDINDGQVVCRQLGYPGANRVYTNSYFGRGTGKIWLTATYCTGTEKNLSSCSHSPWLGQSHWSFPYYWGEYCNHSRDAGVACHNHTAPGLNREGSCTFETGTDLCGYTNPHRLGWSLRSATSYYYGSLPYKDHTYGNGHYIYLRTSYYQYHMFQLVSPQITGGKCVKFYHHMKGSNNAQLNVYVKYGNNKTRIWQQIGGQYSYSTWMMAMVPIEGFTTFQIVFEGGIPDSTSYFGDISLDDIQILNETCIPDNSGNCTFDDGNLCGYTNSKGDDFDWTIHTGSTPNSYATGPQQDHTTGKGNYVYIKTSSPRIAGEIARLISPEIYDTKCVQFYYHMKGTTIGELNVFIDDGVSKKKAWELVGEQSPTWNKGMLPVIGLKAFKIIFEGVAGSDYRGNIALDDITVHNTTCRLFPLSASVVSINIRNITNTVRLASGNVSSAGRVEVFHNGRWGTVCGNSFPLASARVVCRQLGFSDVEMLVPCCSIFPAGKGRILLDDVRCRGDEPAVSLCSHKGWGISRCSHLQDAGVICRTRNTLNNVRLRGSNNTYEGRVEVQIGGIWGTVSDLGWDIYDADVFCREMGFKGATGVYNGAHYGRGSGPVWISNAACNGDETAIWKCNLTLNRNPRIYSYWWWNPHRRDAGVECYDLRLTGGRTKSEGIIEMKYLGTWGTICNDGWDMNDAKVVCRQMGYSRAVSLTLSHSASPSGGINPIITRLQCRGTESSIGLCAYQTLLSVTHQCTHLTDAQVVCAGPLPTASPVTTIKTSPKVPGTIPPTVKPGPSDVRLVGSPDKWQGRIEIFHSGKWGTICDDRVDISIGKVVCRQLGYTDAIAMYPGAAFGKGKGTIWLHNVRCKGSESGLTKCQHSTWNEMNAFCTHLDDLGVACAHSNALPSTPGGCSFDNDLCGYTNANDDDFDWTRHQNSTPSFNTGPAHDHSTGYGQYIYIETSAPRVQGEAARIESPQITGVQCIQFYYHMKGETTGELNVYLDYGLQKKMVWQQIGEISKVWNKATIPTNGIKTPFKIVFEGVAGTSYRGDIAIDDIQTNKTVCQLFPSNAKPQIVNPKNVSQDIRLVGGNISSTGRIEVFYNGRWGTICGNNFPVSSGRVVCKQLGFLDVEMVVPCCSIFGPGKGRIWLDNLNCEGREPDITKCSHHGWGITRCSHSWDVGVICRTKNTLKEVRLAGSSNKFEGRVEVKIAGTWGTISDLGWDIYDANVFCKQAGWAGATGVYNSGHYGRGSGPVWISRVACVGDETALWKCNLTQHQIQRRTSPFPRPWWRNPHQRDAGAECFDLQLVGGRTKNEGIIEIKYRGTWGTICNDGWDMNDGQVLCRQMGYSKVGSLTPINIKVPSNISSPILTKFQCKGDEPSLGICSYRLIMPYSRACSSFSQVVCKFPISKTCDVQCPSCQYTDKYGAICVCSLKNTDVIYQWCDASIGYDVMEVQILNRSVKWNPDKFKKTLADQLNIYCENKSCASQSKFDANDVIVLDNYPKVSNGQDIVLQFIVLDLNSKRPIPQDVLYSMFKLNHNLAGYLVKLPDRHVKPHPHARTGISSKHLKIVVPISVILVIAGIALVLFLAFKKKKNKTLRSVIRYRVQNSDPDNHDNNAFDDDDNEDEQLLNLNNDQAPLLPS